MLFTLENENKNKVSKCICYKKNNCMLHTTRWRRTECNNNNIIFVVVILLLYDHVVPFAKCSLQVKNHLSADDCRMRSRPTATTTTVKVAPTTVDSLTSLHGVSPAISETQKRTHVKNNYFRTRAKMSSVTNIQTIRASVPANRNYHLPLFFSSFSAFDAIRVRPLT